MDRIAGAKPGRLGLVVPMQGRQGTAHRSASVDSRQEGVVVAAVSIRGLDERVKERIRVRAARHGRFALRPPLGQRRAELTRYPYRKSAD